MKNRAFHLPGGRDPDDRLAYAGELAALGEKSLTQDNLEEGMLFYQQAFLILVEELGTDHMEVNRLTDRMGRTLDAQGKIPDARAFLEKSLAASHETEETGNLALLADRLGSWLFTCERANEAQLCYELALNGYEKAYGPNSMQVVYALQKLVGLHYSQGSLRDAQSVLERVLAVDEQVFGKDHPRVAADLSNTGRMQRETGNLAGAVDCYTRAVAILDSGTEPPEDPRLVNDLYTLADLLGLTGDLSGAVMACRKALALEERKLGPDHPRLAAGLIQMGRLQRSLREYSAAHASFERALATLTAALPADHPEVLAAQKELEND
jgi:tetratricopeptide (TPR) repeat protein